MSQFDKDLQHSLRRRQPPAGFAERLFARARAAQKNQRTRSLGRRWIMAGAAVLVLGIALFAYRAHERQIQGEKTKEQLLYALRLTGSTLRNIQERVSQGQGK